MESPSVVRSTVKLSCGYHLYGTLSQRVTRVASFWERVKVIWAFPPSFNFHWRKFLETAPGPYFVSCLFKTEIHFLQENFEFRKKMERGGDNLNPWKSGVKAQIWPEGFGLGNRISKGSFQAQQKVKVLYNGESLFSESLLQLIVELMPTCPHRARIFLPAIDPISIANICILNVKTKPETFLWCSELVDSSLGRSQYSIELFSRTRFLPFKRVPPYNNKREPKTMTCKLNTLKLQVHDFVKQSLVERRLRRK